MPAPLHHPIIRRWSEHVAHEVVTYEGAPHSFVERRYEEHAAAAADAWRRVLASIHDAT